MFKQFKAFIMRGNVLDLAVGIMIGAAFGAIVTSFVNDILMPPIGMLLGGMDFSNLFLVLKGGEFATLAAAQEAGAVTLNYGLFLNAVINFLIVAVAIFLVVRAVTRLRHEPTPPPPNTKECVYCLSTVPLKATRCPYCTSEL